jgi:hypothetical protein
MRLEATRLHTISHNGGFGDFLYDSAGEFPGLDLNFAANKNLTDSISGNNLIGFTRVSSGTYVGADGLLKTAATNLLLRSEEFNNGSWSKLDTTITADAATSPTGTLTADKLVENATTGGKLTAQSVTLIASTTYSASIYIKAAERPTLLFHVRESSYNIRFGGFFNTSTGVFTAESAAGGVLTGSSFTNIGNEWYRCTITGTLGAVTSAVVTGYLANNVNNIGYLGDGTSGLFLWGAQLEQSSTAGEYIPTTSTINSAPRFDHNPTTRESLGLLVEEARTNLFLNSEAMASWGTVTRSTVSSNTTTAPDGTTTADTLIEDNTASNTHEILNTAGVAFVSGTTYTFTVFAKAKERSQVNLFLPGAAFGSGTAQETRFDLQAATTTTVTGSPTAVITALANGWYRCSITAATTTTATGFPRFRLSVGGTTSYTGDNSSGLFLWGAQLEAGAFPTSYIPTTTATVTRAADVASITGTNFSSWYNAAEGTIYSVATATSSTNSDSTATAVGIGAFTDGTNAERIRHGALTFSTVWVDNNTSQANLSSGAFTQNQQVNLASAFKINDFALVRDGGSVQTDATGTLPTLTQVELGRSGVATGLFTGTIRRLTYWPVRLANPTLRAITTP